VPVSHKILTRATLSPAFGKSSPSPVAHKSKSSPASCKSKSSPSPGGTVARVQPKSGKTALTSRLGLEFGRTCSISDFAVVKLCV